MKIAVVSSKAQGETDRLISDLAAKLEAEGLRLSGVVKVLQDPGESEHNCDMDVRVLPNGPAIRITQWLGEGAKGCRLNPAGIVEAVAATERNDLTQIDLFVLNKFGPQEAEGRGFCDAIASALEHDKPVIVGVGKGSRAALDAFVDGIAEVLEPEPEAIYKWCKAAMK